MPDIDMTLFPGSSMLDSAGLDAEGHLIVKFRAGKTYRSAEPVPQAIFDGLGSAESAGKFYNANIRGKYSMREIA
jgi:hypothetical protein